MNVAVLLRGFVLGFAIAVPVGPVGILVIRRTLAGGRALGFASGLGAATADGMYGAVAGFGLTFVSSILVSEGDWIRLFGGAFLVYLGLTTIVSKAAQRRVEAEGRGIIAAYGSTAFLTLTNPATILSFAAAFAGFGLTPAHGNYGAATLLVLGVFLGSAFWWFLLSGGISLIRRRLSAGGMRWVNRISGAMLTLFGVGALVSVAGAGRRSLSP